jgi:IMP dehydrogenase
MEDLMRKAYTFDDVALVPQYNNIPSRTAPSLETWVTTQRKISIPLLASNMDTVICPKLAHVLVEEGTLPIFHRFMPLEEQVKWVQQFQGNCYVSCGLNTDLKDIMKLKEAGALGVCIDIAHGHSDRMLRFISNLKKLESTLEIIAGNVCTTMGYHDLVNAGADAVKVGIGPGAACTTRMVTGFGVPQFTAIYECAKIAEKLRVPLIADGGIRSSRDIVLALAAGASTVMIGKLFAQTQESAGCHGDTVEYRGQASESFQIDYFGGLKPSTVAEGIHFTLPVLGSAKTVIDQLLGGLRSGMTYGGARNIKELQRKAEFVEIAQGYMHESMPRPQHTPLMATADKQRE